mmetsp:Transcript_48438/g.110371  ORF Transcript_48438/g.110371 Transcript_48438/m.110371 type:complete len:95 (+) Transcript_48438:217-501(+)
MLCPRQWTGQGCVEGVAPCPSWIPFPLRPMQGSPGFLQPAFFLLRDICELYESEASLGYDYLAEVPVDMDMPNAGIGCVDELSPEVMRSAARAP